MQYLIYSKEKWMKLMQVCRIFCRFSGLSVRVDVILITLCAVKFHIRLSEQMILQPEQSRELQLHGRQCIILSFCLFVSAQIDIGGVNFGCVCISEGLTSLPSQSRLCMATDGQQWE